MFLRGLLIAVLVAVLCRWALGKWPWEYLGLARNSTSKGQTNAPPSNAPISIASAADLAQARQLLGVDLRANRDKILIAHKGLIAKVHPDRGGSAAQVHEANAARDILLAQLPDQGDRKGQ